MSRDALREGILALIDRLAQGGRDDVALAALLDDLAKHQAAAVPAYGRLVASHRTRPALPTDVFRHARVAAHAPELDVRVFLTSGTTTGARGVHAFRDLALYDRAAHAAARHFVFPDVSRMRLVMLAPHESEAPESSLSYMLSRFASWFGTNVMWAFTRGAIDLDAMNAALREATDAGEPVALLGTSFAFVHADDALGTTRFALPTKSRIMQTGGFKGRSRTIEPDAMRALLVSRYGVHEEEIIAEYGMTELSSQLYETSLRERALGLPRTERHLGVPGWVRATVVDPDSLEPVPFGHEGLLRIDDAANLDSVAAIQTSDVARAVADGIVVRGRAADAVPRGCSIAVDEALGGAP